MVVTIHQPEHLPWLGFFDKMALADIYVYLDTVQFEKNYFQNRNRLVNREGQPFWLTVPVCLVGHMASTIADIRIDNAQPWRRKYWGRIQESYCRHSYFEEYASVMKSLIDQPFELLIDFNLAWIDFFRSVFGIDNRIVRASRLKATGKSTALLLSLCQELGATSYLSGPTGRDYLEVDAFRAQGIGVEFHSFIHPPYAAKAFMPNLSALDLVLNHGEKSRSILFGETQIVDSEGSGRFHDLPA